VSKLKLSITSSVAFLALFFALGGSAIAAKHYLITSTSQIKPSVLNQLHGREGAQGPAGPSGAAGIAGPQGTPGAQGPAGPSNLSTLEIVEGPKNAIPAKAAEVSVATCPAGKHVVSGGGSAISDYGLAISYMSSNHLSWNTISYETDSGGTIQAFVYCAGAGQAVAARSNSAAHNLNVQEAKKIAINLEKEIQNK
jgi:hypothetical protein